MVLDELEARRRESLIFQKAQCIIALLEGLESNDIEAILKLAKEIQQSDKQRDIAIVSYRKKL